MSFFEPKKVCECCFNDVLKREDTFLCKKGCTFCRSCVKLGAETRISDGLVDFPCLADCDSEFTMQTLQMVLKHSDFARVSQFKLNKFTNRSEKFCCICECVSHDSLHCQVTESDEQVKTRTYIENKMTEAIVRKCPNCKKAYIKETGCSSVKCVCGAKMLYDGCCNDAGIVLRAAEAAKAELGVNVNPEKLKIDPAVSIMRFFK